MINSIKLKNFRCYDELNLDKFSNLVIFSGKNATGKTSILEAIHISSFVKSHRTNDLKKVIKFDKDFTEIEIKSNKKLRIVISNDSKSFFVNNSQINKIANFIGLINVIMISPEDMYLIKGSKDDKRRFLDMNLSLLDKEYFYELSKYKKILAERNLLLKNEKIDNIMLNVLTEDLVKSLNIIYQKRVNFINKINDYLVDICKNLKIGNLNLIYKPSYNPNDILKSFLNKTNQDMFLKSTSIGSHRDTFIIELDNKDVASYISEGQARITYIAIKLALKMIIEEKNETILLLDDIFSSLDSTKIESLTNYVSKSNQVFITTTSILDIPDNIIKNAVVIRL